MSYKKLMFALLACFMPSLGISAQGDRILAGKEAEEVVTKITAAHESLASINADFIQSKSSSLFSGTVVQKGRFGYAFPDRIKWDYTYPTKMSVNFNDKSNKMVSQLKGLIVNTINGYNLTDNRNFKPTYVRKQDESVEVVLTPINKRLRSMYQSITISLDKDTFLARHISFKETSGDVTEISFVNQETTRK